ncbi:hypothetical protein NB550_21510 [Vibrio parahaemolyticus]|uniref:hypothetical protein n=1 Tax=Vibrio parahaemolyticus TaxID=670 RepID=UPI00215D5570|nr:hypothetical protein [Vibrio parahaemolyticus]EKH9208465.1 hypothetical protein [Vibrio parahaemolyticus]MCR9888673.1 hypothetical protein [Vibrio parahaemolyticus]MCR9920064.1 hypothetical protein [Vibrio parahaemolyticus]
MLEKKAISFAIHHQSFQILHHNDHIKSLIQKGADYANKNGYRHRNLSAIEDMTKQYESLLDDGKETENSRLFSMDRPTPIEALNDILDRLSETNATTDSLLIIDSYPLWDESLLPVLIKLKKHFNFYTPIDDKLHTDTTSYEALKESLKLTSKREYENRRC